MTGLYNLRSKGVNVLQYLYRSDAPLTSCTFSRLDQRWTEYAPIAGRPRLEWPAGARVALWICPNILHYELTPAPDPWLEMWSRMPQPDVLAYGRQDYGNRVGFWRVLEVLDAHKARCTACVNVEALERYPEIRRAAIDRGWRFLGHGMNNSRFIYGHTPEQEREYYSAMREQVQSLTGAPLLGMGGPGPQSATENTPDILAELGFLYHADWFHDDQPFPLRVGRGRLISLPYSIEINDAAFLASGFEADQFAEIIKRQFDTLWNEGSEQGRVMCLSVHPALLGQPQRVKYLDDALSYVLSRPGVWQATGDEIAEYYFTNCYDAVVAWLESRN